MELAAEGLKYEQTMLAMDINLVVRLIQVFHPFAAGLQIRITWDLYRLEIK